MVGGQTPLHRSRWQIHFLLHRQRRERLRLLSFQAGRPARVQFLLGPPPAEMEGKDPLERPQGLRQPADRRAHSLLHPGSRPGIPAPPLRRDGRHAHAGASAIDRLARQRQILDLLFLRQRRYSKGEAAGAAGGRVPDGALERAAGRLVRQQRLGRADESGAAPERGEGLHQLAAVVGRPARVPENRQYLEQLRGVAQDRHPEGDDPGGAPPQRQRQISDVRPAGVYGHEADLRGPGPDAGGEEKINREASMAETNATLYQRIHPYETWIKSLGVPVHRGYYVEDLRTVEVGRWDERDPDAAFLQLAGQEGVTGAHLTGIGPGKTLPPFRSAVAEAGHSLPGRGINTAWDVLRFKKGFPSQS